MTITKEESDRMWDTVYAEIKTKKGLERMLDSIIEVYLQYKKGEVSYKKQDLKVKIEDNLNLLKLEIAKTCNKDINKLFLIQLTTLILIKPFSLIEDILGTL